MIIFDTGERLERRRSDGSLEPLSVDEIVDNSFMRGGVIMSPSETWVKDFSGQVTIGRIGRPVIRYNPVDWLPAEVAAQVKEQFLDHR